ncbi:MAG TPA: hypothetical protein VKA40_10180 [Nitrososphaera sp.]|jgi:hypothetical protein|nr:hypothetical protein [Nitrososphaera sp.]
MMSAPPLDLNTIGHSIVKSAIEAMNSRNKKQWYALFSDNPTFTDDGNFHDFTDWCEKELFGSSLAYLASIDKVEDRGLTIYGRFHSDQWGDFKTFLKFHVDNGKITKMAVGQANY